MNGGLMIRIAICDDDRIILDYTYNQIKIITDELRKDIYIQAFSDGDEMLTGITKDRGHFNILFLDIDMPIATGFEIAEVIRKFDENLIIIFLTSMEHLVYESFKYKPFRFIRKNRLGEELKEVLNSAITVVDKNKNNHYIFKTEHGTVKICLEDILYIESLNRKIYLKTNKETYNLIGIQYSEIVGELLDKGFVMVHRGCIINLKYIYSIGKIDVTLDNGEKLPMSRYKVSDVKRAFALYAK